jgi:hypothetical protein
VRTPESGTISHPYIRHLAPRSHSRCLPRWPVGMGAGPGGDRPPAGLTRQLNRDLRHIRSQLATRREAEPTAGLPTQSSRSGRSRPCLQSAASCGGHPASGQSRNSRLRHYGSAARLAAYLHGASYGGCSYHPHHKSQQNGNCLIGRAKPSPVSFRANLIHRLAVARASCATYGAAASLPMQSKLV